MTAPYFFGYGSLVNAATHSYPDARPARLTGWRRAWRHTDLREVAFLTVIPDPASTIDGMIAHVPGGDWAALDEREWAYDRIAATDAVRHTLETPAEIAIYAVPASRAAAPSVRHPILLSYLDVVVQGYLQVFGDTGARAFFASTDGWDAPILNDRAAPRYPRHQSLSGSERALIDAELVARGARILPA